MPVAGDFRTPRVRVDVVLGGVMVAFAVVGLKHQAIEVRAPVVVESLMDGAVVELPPDLQSRSGLRQQAGQHATSSDRNCGSIGQDPRVSAGAPRLV
jgi:hypothetical protein